MKILNCIKSLVLGVGIASFGVAGCSSNSDVGNPGVFTPGEKEKQDKGELEVVLVAQAFVVNDIGRIDVTIGETTESIVVTPENPLPDTMSFNFPGLVANQSHAVTGKAFHKTLLNDEGTPLLIYEGSDTVTVEPNGTGTLNLILHAVTPTTPDFLNSQPVIDGVFVEKVFLANSEAGIRISVSGHDNDGDNFADGTLTVEWETSNGGVVAEPTSPSTTYTAPAEGAQDILTVTLTDSLGANYKFSITLSLGEFDGEAIITIAKVDINQAPTITNILSSNPSPLDLDEEATLSVSVTDPDVATHPEDATFTYLWTNQSDRLDNSDATSPQLCKGRFDPDNTAASPKFIVEAPEGGLPIGGPCVLQVAITDGRGGGHSATNVAIYVLQSGGDSNGVFPMITTAERDHLSNAAGGGQTVETRNHVEHDSQGATCGATGTTTASIAHALDSADQRRFIRLSHTIQDNTNDDCGDFAQASFPIVDALAQDMTSITSVKFDAASLVGAQSVKFVFVENAARDCDGLTTFPRAESAAIPVGATWETISANITDFNVEAAGCPFDFTKVGVVGIKVEGAGAARELGLDNIELVR